MNVALDATGPIRGSGRRTSPRTGPAADSAPTAPPQGAARPEPTGRLGWIVAGSLATGLLTGLTRDGLWWIENGKVQYPVRNLRFNQSPIQMLAPGNVELIGGSERVGPSENQGSGAMLAPALKLKAFTFTSVSDAV